MHKYTNTILYHITLLFQNIYYFLNEIVIKKIFTEK